MSKKVILGIVLVLVILMYSINTYAIYVHFDITGKKELKLIKLFN